MLIQRSITASILIVLIVIIRALAINKLPKRTFLILWLASMIHLLIPFQISSRFSIYNMFNNNSNIDVMVKKTVVNTSYIPSSIKIPVKGISEAKYKDNFGFILTLIWLIGFLLCMLYFIGLIYYSKTKIMYSSQLDNEFIHNWLKQHKIYRKIEIRQSEDLISPLTYGIIKPVILIPRTMDWKNQEQLQYVFLHELTHIKYFDGLLKIILLFTLSVYWFNPVVWVMFLLANRDIELACDETVIRRYGEEGKRNYALMLIGLEEKQCGAISIMNNFSKSAIEERIRLIMKMKKKSFVATIIASSLVLTLILLFTTSSIANKNNLNTDEELKKVEEQMLEEDAKADRTDDKSQSNYTNEEYELVTSLKTDDYLNLTVAEFDNKLDEEINKNDEFLETWTKVYDGINDSDTNYSFVSQDLAYSCIAYMKKMMNETPYVENAASYREFPFYCDAYYYLEYEIKDENKITLGERAQIFQQIHNELNLFVKNMGKEALLSSTAEDKINEQLQQIISGISNPYIVIKGEVSSFSNYNGENSNVENEN